jgi:molybdopterin-containing oxidoreductase family membrane subunit
VPGWHSTLFPPYFVVGAIHSGFALVVLLLLPLRHAYGLENVVTDRHLDAIARMLLATACLMGYCYATEHFTAWYSGNAAERDSVNTLRMSGRHAWLYWSMLVANVFLPQILWVGAARRSRSALVVVCVAVLVGMWIERFLIIAGSLEHDRLPSSWGVYTPTVVDGALYLGSLSLFTFLFLLFVRYVPMVPVAEVKALAWEESREQA